MDTKNWLLAVGCVLIPMAVGGFSGWATSGETGGEWFRALNKPSFQPPDWVFGPVWTTLYVLMGISLFIIWRQPDTPKRKSAFYIFFLQLMLNFAWSFIFFYFHQMGAALLEIIVLWILILMMIIAARVALGLVSQLGAKPNTASCSFTSAPKSGLSRLRQMRMETSAGIG